MTIAPHLLERCAKALHGHEGNRESMWDRLTPGDKQIARDNAESVLEAAQYDKVVEVLELLVHLHMCEQEGISSGQPKPEQWIDAVDKASSILVEVRGAL